MSTLVFVYGSLLEGFGNHRLLGGSTLVGAGETLAPMFTMRSLGAYPGVRCQRASRDRIVGEVYEVDSGVFSRLDLLEGYPRLYTRELIDVELEDGREVTAWIYLYQGTGRQFDRLEYVPRGDWRAFVGASTFGQDEEEEVRP